METKLLPDLVEAGNVNKNLHWIHIMEHLCWKELEVEKHVIQQVKFMALEALGEVKSFLGKNNFHSYPKCQIQYEYLISLLKTKPLFSMQKGGGGCDRSGGGKILTFKC